MTKQFLCVALGLAAFAATPERAKGEDIEFGKKYEGELGGKKKVIPLKSMSCLNDYAAQYTVALKAGQKVTVAGTVLGEGRKLILSIQDPTGLALKTVGWQENKATLEIDGVAATGTYKVTIASLTVGAYTLRVTSPDAKKSDAKSRDEKIKRLEAELKALKEEKALEDRPQRSKP